MDDVELEAGDQKELPVVEDQRAGQVVVDQQEDQGEEGLVVEVLVVEGQVAEGQVVAHQQVDQVVARQRVVQGVEHQQVVQVVAHQQAEVGQGEEGLVGQGVEETEDEQQVVQ